MKNGVIRLGRRRPTAGWFRAARESTWLFLLRQNNQMGRTRCVAKICGTSVTMSCSDRLGEYPLRRAPRIVLLPEPTKGSGLHIGEPVGGKPGAQRVLPLGVCGYLLAEASVQQITPVGARQALGQTTPLRGRIPHHRRRRP